MAEGQSTISTRWNPTSEQIALLEATYCQGIRTPNGGQTEQIVNRLRMYGNIEGKNVYYRFRNRKARKRQRQKRERMAFLNQFLQPPSLAVTSHTNKQKSATVVMPKINVTSTDHDNRTRNADNLCEPPTLELFPLHPTGMACANPQSVQQQRNDSRSDEYSHEQNDPRSGRGRFPFHPSPSWQIMEATDNPYFAIVYRITLYTSVLGTRKTVKKIPFSVG